MASFPVLFGFFLAGILVQAYRVWRRRTLGDIQGPPPSSLLLGNEPDVRYQERVGDAEFQWARQYGGAWRTLSCFGSEVLMVADAKAIQYITHTSAYNFPKHMWNRMQARLVTGRGVLWAEGHEHQRHRKVMNPIFSAAQLRTYVPVVRRWVSHLSSKWREEVFQPMGAAVQIIDIPSWASKASLDALCEVAFDYRIGALDNQNNELLDSLDSLLLDAAVDPPKAAIVFAWALAYMPEWVAKFVEYLPTRQIRRCRSHMHIAKGVVRNALSEHLTVHSRDVEQLNTGAKDALSVLVAANASENPKGRLDDDEMLSQMTTLLLAGYDTTSATLSWLLWELSKHPEDQSKIRKELRSLRAKATARGDTDLELSELESLPYFSAAIKEVLRLHPIVFTMYRRAAQDDVIPLSTPIITRSGKSVSAIPVSKGQEIRIFAPAYHRIPEIWGRDADDWNPRRWFDKAQDKQTVVGVYANLFTFSAGVMSCIGWRFALIQLQILLAELIENFEFFPPEDGIEIIGVPGTAMEPAVRGKPGVQLPLRVSLAQ